MTSKKQKVLVAGWLVILAVVAFVAFDERRSPSLNWTLLLSAMWACAVWLWSPLWNGYAATAIHNTRKALSAVARAGRWFLMAGGAIAFPLALAHNYFGWSQETAGKLIILGSFAFIAGYVFTEDGRDHLGKIFLPWRW